jgi:uncharacterized protein (TIRG00374 family)
MGKLLQVSNMTLRSWLKRLWRPRWLVWALLLIVAGWAGRNLPFSEILSNFQRLTPVQLTGWIILNLVILTLASMRWQTLLQAQGQSIPILSIAGYRMASYAMSYFAPGPQLAGEAMQVYMIQKRHKVPSATAISTVVLDKSMEILANFLFIIVGGAVIVSSRVINQAFFVQFILLMCLFLCLPISYFTSLWRGSKPAARFLQWLKGLRKNDDRLNRWIEVAANAEGQMICLFKQKPRVMAQVFVLSLFIWVVLLIDYALAMSFFGLQLNLVETISALTAARIAFLTPIPGGLGAYEASQVMVMTALGLSPAVGVSLSLIVRGRDLLMGGVGLGLVGWLTR